MPSLLADMGRAGVRGLDALLRRCLGVIEFTQDPACILRIAVDPAPASRTLADGTQVVRGERIVSIHLWNERLPHMPAQGPDLAWARATYQGFVASLRLLNAYLRQDPTLATLPALVGITGFLTASDLDAGASLLTRLGFEVERLRPGEGSWGRFAEFWENLYSWLIIWTFNPASLHHKRLLSLERCRLWMSRATLESRYGQAPPSR